MSEKLTFDILFNIANKPLAQTEQRINKLGHTTKRQFETIEKSINKTFRTHKIKINTSQAKRAKYNIEQLERRLNELNRIRRISVDIRQIKAANREIAHIEKQISRLKTTGSGGSGLFGKLGGLSGMLPALGAGALVGGAISLGKQIFEIRRERQKMEAVLTTAFNGDNDMAKMQMQMIEQFAAKTPYSVNELTEAFIKLKNQGFQPSMEEMRKMGDLAASVGKSYDQLAEAILDARMGEFERLKTFGIKAKVQGDKIKFIFKEQETVVDNTSDAIQKYLLSLGDMNGVMGSMENISNTLDGKISNLGDSWDRLMNTIGQSTDSVFTKVIDWINMALNGLEQVLRTADQIKMSSKTEGSQYYKDVAKKQYEFYKKKGFDETTAKKMAYEDVKYQIEHDKKDFEKQIKIIKRKNEGVLDPFGLYESNKNKKIAHWKGQIEAGESILENWNSLFQEEQKTKTASTNGKVGKSLETTVSDARAAKNLTINISKLIESLNITTETFQESAEEMTEAVKKALLTAVNDANYVVS